jgi:hypothetical protein
MFETRKPERPSIPAAPEGRGDSQAEVTVKFNVLRLAH